MNLHQAMQIIQAALLAGAMAPMAATAEPDASGNGTLFAGADVGNQDSSRFNRPQVIVDARASTTVVAVR